MLVNTESQTDRIKNMILDNLADVPKYIILLVYANNEPLMGKTKLQKSIFLLSDEIDAVKEDCSYEPDNYGPYSEVVDYELRDLEEVGVIHSSHGKIEMTRMGREIAEELVKKEDRSVLSILSKQKAFLNDLTTNEVLAYIYAAYPEMTSESIKIGELKPKMEDYIAALVKKQKISLQRAAELLEISTVQAAKKISSKGIQISV